MRFLLHPAKTGGTSIVAKLLENKQFQKLYGHYYTVVPNSHPRPDDCAPGTKFAITVRCPYTRMLSMTRWYNNLNVQFYRDTEYNISKLIKLYQRFFQQQIHKNRFDDTGADVNHTYFTALASCSQWHNLVNNNSDVSIIKFENLASDAEQVYSIRDLPNKNNVGHTLDLHYVEKNFDTTDTLSLFNELFVDDFQKYNYIMYNHIDDLLDAYSKNPTLV